jgi:hypothetical protein
MNGRDADGRGAHANADALRELGRPACPVCGGRMWDNRTRKTNPKAPDFKCRTPECAGRIWPGQLTVETHADVPAGVANRATRPGPLADAVRSVVETVTARTRRAQVRAELRACYLDSTEFVLDEVRAKYEAAGVPCTDATVAAITATVFIATCNRGAIGPDDDEPTPTPKDAA